MEEVIKQLKKIFQFKEETLPGDVVILFTEENKTVNYALVMDIIIDESKKDEWWEVYLLFLQMPPLISTVLLRTPQMNGQETFTMGGNGRFMAPLKRLEAEEIKRLRKQAVPKQVEEPKKESPFKVIDGGKD